MSESSPRVRTSADLGEGKRGLDLLLGSAAMVPLVALAALDWISPPGWAAVLRTLAVIWTGALMAFYAGVRRGLTFSETRGGRPGELVTMLALFFLGVATLVLISPWLGAAGLAAVGVLDAWAGRRWEAPPYFVLFRPPQMALGVLAMAAVALRGG